MKVIGNTIKCECGFVIFNGTVLRIRVGLFANNRMTLKCPRCKRFEDSLPIEILSKEWQDNNKDVAIHTQEKNLKQ